MTGRFFCMKPAQATEVRMDMKWMAKTAADISDPLDRLTFCRTYQRTLTPQQTEMFKALLNQFIVEKQRPILRIRRHAARDAAP